MNIPIFKLNFDDKLINEFKKRSEEILRSNRPLGEYSYVREFEEKFARLIGAKYCVATTNGTTAIELALKALNVKGKTVIIPANTFFATAVATINAGAAIGLVDIEDENFSLSPERLEEEIKIRLGRKEKIGAVMIVHIGGIISKHIKKIKKICDRYNIPLVEDAAHAHCSELGGLRAGTIGKVGAFSFFPTKVMTTGEGGMLATNDLRIYKLAKSLKNFGRDLSKEDLCINPDGSNFKISEFTGLLGALECDRVISRIKKRNKLVKIYVKKLTGSSYSPVLQSKGVCSHYKMILKTKINREWLRKYCRKNNITLTGEVYKIPVHKQPLYKDLFKKDKFPVSDYVSDNHICPPLYPELSEKEINYICDVLLKAEKDYEKQNRKIS
jgi:dTDP-4-amino-4,6-dideoxygalactose transaminase